MMIWTMLITMITRSSRRYGSYDMSRTIQNIKRTSYVECILVKLPTYN